MGINRAVAHALRQYLTRGGTSPDPRKHSKARKPRRTDARTGFGYFFADGGEKIEYQTADLSDKSMTKAQRNRLLKLGCVVK